MRPRTIGLLLAGLFFLSALLFLSVGQRYLAAMDGVFGVAMVIFVLARRMG